MRALSQSWRLKFRRAQLLGFLFVVSSMGISLWLGFSGTRDAYPFFSWSLFTHVPNVRFDFGVAVTEIDGEILNPPRDLMELEGRVSGAGSIRAYYTIQDLGDALVRRDRALMQEKRSLFEREYLSGPTELRYRLVARAYDPIEKWRHGRIQQQRVLAERRRRDQP